MRCIMYNATTKDPADIQSALDIAESLPLYFTSDALSEMAHNFQYHDLYIIKSNDQALGFISLDRKSDSVAEISWLAVLECYQRNGIGSQLLELAITGLKREGFRILEVKTLAKTANYEPYEKTHRFYRKHGFISLETIMPYPGWDIDCPCEIYVKIILEFNI